MVIMESQEQAQPMLSVERPTLTPKALIHHKYGTTASYSIEEVQQHADSGCPGLVIPQQVKVLYRCHLNLPDLSVTSDTFTRKKDAEQSAAKIAIEKLGIQSTTSNPTPEESSKELVARISSLFNDEFLSSSHPLIGHFGVAFGANREHFGMIPIVAIIACDVKANNLCKVIDCKAESNPLLVSSLVLNAARVSSSLCTADDELWIWKQAPYSAKTIESVNSRDSGSSLGCVQIGATYIPCSIKENVEALTLDVSDEHYYLDVIAQKLNVKDSSRLLVSRTVGKASSEMKLYFPFREVAHSRDDSLGLFTNPKGNEHIDSMLNKRACYLSGQDIYGDAILANIGYSWKSSNLFYEDVSLSTYYRLLLAKVPDGHYKLSREAILAAELPTAYTGRSNWKGPTPKDLLCAFCRQHRLPEPLFSVLTIKKNTSLSDTQMKSDVSHNNLDNSGTFRCEVKILSRRMETMLEGSFADIHRKESDAIHCSALKVLLWFNKYFKQLDMPVERLSSLDHSDGISVNVETFCQEFAMCLSIFGFKQNDYLRICSSLGSFCKNDPNRKYKNGMVVLNTEGPESAVFPSPGSLICISYTVELVRIGDPVKYHLESKDEFEFEVGTGAVTYQIETCVSQLSVNQSAVFVMDMPSKDLILAVAGEAVKHLSEIPLYNCFLEYSLKILRVAQPLEERMEQALFSPSLSRQRVEFAIQQINESCACTLVDFGCGSGSLLDSLLAHSTTLEKIVGVDISQKSLARAAKILHQKLSLNSGAPTSIRHAVLYDGSITVFDSRLAGFDMGTCLEVIEHMEEGQAHIFGDVVLSSFSPKILVVSTPNYEYNSILQKSAMPTMEEKTAPCKFRNHDHKFEWTREQFECWATDLASRHNYRVEFGGVGGSADVEPGFASQIAVFRRSSSDLVENYAKMEDSPQPYELIWEWSHSCRSSF
ncbi:small RNA 2'-O-methyltransferase isoform X1 [Canna indica]|uniref:Small RNA 2'-O-methyltransferase n=1 Tax=Canna indica TaxID=4628 RepID=A0AAQ3Q3F0_9LILI|nr:small RNA 2'-O-methyltransferase isoform X1 [Canna indica]